MYMKFPFWDTEVKDQLVTQAGRMFELVLHYFTSLYTTFTGEVC